MSNNDQFLRIECGYASGKVKRLLRADALVMPIASTMLFFWLGGQFWLFSALFFAPDLSLLGYTAGQKVGAAVYNDVQNYVLPLLLIVVGILAGFENRWQIPLITIAHAAFDRSLGYGLGLWAEIRGGFSPYPPQADWQGFVAKDWIRVTQVSE